jgi:hypothetical protein
MDCDSSESGRFRIGVRWIFQATAGLCQWQRHSQIPPTPGPLCGFRSGKILRAPIQVSNRLMANRGPLSHRIRVKR